MCVCCQHVAGGGGGGHNYTVERSGAVGRAYDSQRENPGSSQALSDRTMGKFILFTLL